MTETGAPLVEVTGLTKRYGGITAVDGIDVTVGAVRCRLPRPERRGQDTTTLRILIGLIAPSSGSVRVLGAAPGDPRALARTGSLVEAPAFYPYLSGRNNLRVLAGHTGAPATRVDEVLETVDRGIPGARDDRGRIRRAAARRHRRRVRWSGAAHAGLLRRRLYRCVGVRGTPPRGGLNPRDR